MFPFDYIYKSHAGAGGCYHFNLHLLSSDDLFQKCCFQFCFWNLFLLRSSEIKAAKQLTWRPEYPKLNHHLIKPYSYTVNWKCLCAVPQNFWPQLWVHVMQWHEGLERTSEKCVFVCHSAKMLQQSCHKPPSPGLECSYPESVWLTVTHMLIVGAEELLQMHLKAMDESYSCVFAVKAWTPPSIDLCHTVPPIKPARLMSLKTQKRGGNLRGSLERVSQHTEQQRERKGSNSWWKGESIFSK